MNKHIALIGTPNCGKSLLFNTLTKGRQHVGNWPSVTVERKEGPLSGHKGILIQDLPGIYSLGDDTLEERITKGYLQEGAPELIINVIDATNIESGLFLTQQLLESDIPVLVAVNMIDIAEKEGLDIDYKGLAGELCCPVLPVSALRKTGIERLKSSIMESLPLKVSAGDITSDPQKVENSGRLKKEYVKDGTKRNERISRKIDSVLTNKFLGLPIFIAIMFLIYYVSITGFGKTMAMFIKKQLFGVYVTGSLRSLLAEFGVAQWMTGLVVDGIVSGVGSVLRFAPRLFLLFLFISILEDSGYMARVAFILDRIFRSFGLSGKSFIPLFVSSGCTVPGIMACKTIENQKNRKITIMTASFIPCGMKMAVVAMFAGSIFGGSGAIAVSVYFAGLFSVLVSGRILKKFMPLEDDNEPFIIVLPPYRIPALRNVWENTWERIWSFIKRAGSIIMLMSVVIWFLHSFGFTDGHFGMLGPGGKSILAAIGGSIAFIFNPLGFGFWQAVVAVINGFVVKSGIVGTLGVLYGFAANAHSGPEIAALLLSDFTPLSAYSFLLFNLLCMPCIGTVGTIRREMNNPKWTWATIAYQFLFAYAVSFIFYQLGLLFSGESFTLSSAVSFLVMIFFLMLVFGKRKKKEAMLNVC